MSVGQALYATLGLSITGLVEKFCVDMIRSASDASLLGAFESQCRTESAINRDTLHVPEIMASKESRYCSEGNVVVYLAVVLILFTCKELFPLGPSNKQRFDLVKLCVLCYVRIYFSTLQPFCCLRNQFWLRFSGRRFFPSYFLNRLELLWVLEFCLFWYTTLLVFSSLFLKTFWRIFEVSKVCSSRNLTLGIVHWHLKNTIPSEDVAESGSNSVELFLTQRWKVIGKLGKMW